MATARQATYPSKALQELPDEIVARYFESVPAGLCFRSDLRRSIIFGRNDIVQDAPISRIDLLVCRNALMYFTPDTQLRILARLHFALRESGYLFLGKSEMITHAELFTPESLKWRIFTKVPRATARDRFSFTEEESSTLAPAADRYARLRDGALDVSPVAQVALDRGGFVAGANQPARAIFGLGPADIGRPLQDLQLSYRPVELRSALEQAYAERSAVELGRVGWRLSDGDVRTLQVRVVPLYGARGAELGTTITFEDVTELARLDDEHQRSQRKLEAAYEELQSTVEELETTNEELQSTNEELETTNEELDTTNEELQSTNEELQSANEELETMNEELQSANDELEVVNDEQREQSRQLNQLTLFLEGILGSLDLAVVVLDHKERVQLWNGMAQELWGLRAEEVVDRSFFELDLGLPVDRLRAAVTGALGTLSRPGEATLAAINRRGRPIHCMVRTMPLGEAGGETLGAIILMREQGAETGTGP